MAFKQDEAELLAETLSEIINKKPAQKKTYKLKRQVKIAIGAFIVICIISMAVALLLELRQSDSPLSRELKVQQKKVSYSLYAPAVLPTSYTPESASTVNEDGVVFTTLTSSDNTKPAIIISQQATPKDASIQNLLGLVPPEIIETPNGNLYLASTETHLTGILVTEDSWIVMSAEKSLSSDTFKDLAKNYRPVK